MSLRFEDVHLFPLCELSFALDDGTIAGLVGPDGSGKSLLLRLAAGRVAPERGRVEASPETLLVEIGCRARVEIGSAIASGPRVLLLDHALAVLDAAAQAECVQRLDALRRRGAVVVVSSHDLALLERISDVVLALDSGRLVEQGDPGLVLSGYRTRMVARIRELRGLPEIRPSSRHGDGRVEITTIELVGQNGAPSTMFRSGEEVTMAATLRFREFVGNPVAGILIRNRVGVSVYGTNTELEQVPIGPRRAGETAVVEFRFRCDLCPQEYTVTFASHDPDGTAHDWLEEAVLFSVVDTRSTAGVANLRAQIRIR